MQQAGLASFHPCPAPAKAAHWATRSLPIRRGAGGRAETKGRIPAATYTTALNNLHLVFQELAKTNLHLNPAKCSLSLCQTSFLGHVVIVKGVSMDPAKVEAVEQWPVPSSTLEVQSFLGLAW
ncbi:hypothetical protein AAFF_G00365590 [Aldrovandia affinis]|uniref:Uncharacterized protein n=1 Tax=Aldrovandia affinis TaxID=143900 RepID=A0AAD7WMG3_9TELE|nr:hypothetical protein AAFF_G00365590 [Aldrovandia affinis]